MDKTIDTNWCLPVLSLPLDTLVSVGYNGSLV